MADDYTPSEARVCIDYCNAATKRPNPDGSVMTMEEADAAFTRFLAEKRAEWEAEQGEPEWGVGWSATGSLRVMGFPLSSREEAEAHVRESNADPDDDVRYFLVQRTPERQPGGWLPVPDTAKEGNRPALVDNRDPECVKVWPGCHTFGYDPACCRFPKSCSAGGFEPVPDTTSHENED